MVSIHTPVWGVTRHVLVVTATQADSVSIHTPVWGVTDRFLDVVFSESCFNPHPRMGGDRNHI